MSQDTTAAPEQTTGPAPAATPPRPPLAIGRPSLIEAIGTEALATRDPDVILSRALDFLDRNLRSASGLLFLQHIGTSLKVAAAHGEALGGWADRTFDYDGSLVAAVSAGEPVLIIPDIVNEKRLGFTDTITGRLGGIGARSLIVAAAGTAGAFIAISPQLDAFTTIDANFVRGVAVQTGYVLQNVTDYVELEEAYGQLTGALQVAPEESGDLSKILMPVLRTVVDRLGAETGSVMLADEKAGVLIVAAAIGLPEAVVGGIQMPLGQGIAGWVAKNRRPVVIHDFPEGEAAPGAPAGAKIVNSISFPLLVGDRLIGVVNVGSRRRDHRFAEPEINAVTRLIGQSAAAVERSRDAHEMRGLFFDTLRALAQVIETRDPFGRGHSARVARYATAIAEAMQIAADERTTIELAAILHDIGIAGIHDAVFRQSQPLTTVERVLIKAHPRLATEALGKIPKLREVVPIILHHHENWDGSGYVDGLKGEEIPLGARILAVAEAFAAMTAERPYRQAKPVEMAVDELRKNAGLQFDPQVVYAFCRLLETNPALTRDEEQS